MSGDLQAMKHYVESHHANANQAWNEADELDESARTPRYLAAGYGQISVVRCLIGRSEMDVNKAADEGQTPIFAAAWSGHLEIVRCLVEMPEVDVNQATIGSVSVTSHADIL